MSHHETATLKRTSDQTVELLREVTAALNRGDMDVMANALADDVEWYEIGRAEPIRGKAALLERWSGMSQAGGSFSVELHDVLANDDHAISLATATVSNGDHTFSYRTAEIHHMRDGKITARWAFSDDTAAINAFFGGT